jgi:hypothetical protein
MVFTDYGDMGLGQLQAGIGSVLNVFQQRQQQQQMQQLGQQIQSGDLLGAAQTAISRGDISTGLKLYELHRKTGDEAGLGSAIQGIFGGGTPAKLTTMGPRASAGVPADASAYAAPIAGGETSATDPTAYSRLGPVIGPGHSLAGDRAYGKFQVMGSNVGPWTKEILGQEMTPEEFLANPQAQEAVFKGKFGQYVQQTGDPKAAAAMWFSGSPNTQSASRDQLGTSVPSYVSGFARRLGDPPAQPGGSALAYAPASQAITSAMGGFTAPGGVPLVDPNRGQDPDSAPITLAASTTPGAPRRLGSPPPDPRPLGQPLVAEEDDPQIAAKIAQRNQLIGLMPQARGTKYETMIPAAIKSIEDEITQLRDPKNKGTDVTNTAIARDKIARSNNLVPGSPEYRHYMLTGQDLRADKAQTEAEIRQQRGADAEKQGLAPGTPEYRHYVLTGQELKAEDKAPAHVTIKNPDGSETVMVHNPATKSWAPMEGVPKPPVDPNVPAGVDPKEYAKKKADAAVKADIASEDSKKTAEQLIPIIDEARDAYAKLTKHGVIGPTHASAPWRYAASVTGSPDEALRQRYEMAQKRLELLQSRVYMKGQGAVSDFERKMISRTFPGLDAADGQIGLDALDRMKKELQGASHKIEPSPSVGLPVGEKKVINGATVERVD